MHGLRKQVTEAKEGPLEFGRMKGKENTPGGSREGHPPVRESTPWRRKGLGKGMGMLKTEKEHTLGPIS